MCEYKIQLIFLMSSKNDIPGGCAFFILRFGDTALQPCILECHSCHVTPKPLFAVGIPPPSF